MSNKKNGVTLVVLVATIIIAIILLSVSIAVVGNSVKNANLVAFREELTNVYDEVTRYYSLSGDLPKLDENKYSISDIASLSYDSTKFMNETTQNNELEDSYFVKIDLSKLEIDKSVRGNLKDGVNGKDVFVVNYPSFNIYYLAGFKEGNDVYFSLANLSNNKKFQDDSNELQTVKFSGDLRVTKTINTWSNKLNIKILTFMEIGETLTATIPQGSGSIKTVDIATTSSKTNDITLETLEALGYSSSDINKFNALTQNEKKITIMKKIGTNITGKVEIDLFNYDSTIPTVDSSVTQSSYSDYNSFSFEVSDTLSGVKSIRYEYYSKVEDGASSLYLANDSMYTKDYLLKSGKEEIISENNVLVKVPKNVISIKYVIIDKAGNTTDILTLDTKYPILIKYATVSGTNSSVTFNASVDTTYTLTSFTTAFSVDGTNYTAPYAHSGSRINSFTYTDITNMNDYVFIKLVAVADGVTETRVVKIATKDFTKEGTTNKLEANSYNPYIPEGFVHTIGNVRTGFVIQDVSNTNNKYNEFVWIPVDYIKTTINADNTIVANSSTINTLSDFRSNFKIDSTLTKSTIDTTALSNLYSEPYSTDLTEYNNIINSINTYGGFYVARYEAGTTESRSSTSSNTQLVIRKNAYPYNYIKLSNSINDATGGAIELSKNLYLSSTDIKSNLIYGFEWDIVMYFISIVNAKNVSNSNSFGNYTSSKIMTGSNENYSSANIYDLAGNLEEWTMESYNAVTRTVRSGNLTLKAAANRDYSYVVETGYENVGFRPALYIID